jgi:hypothetical protein
MDGGFCTPSEFSDLWGVKAVARVGMMYVAGGGACTYNVQVTQ